MRSDCATQGEYGSVHVKRTRGVRGRGWAGGACWGGAWGTRVTTGLHAHATRTSEAQCLEDPGWISFLDGAW